jgi:MYXO-CTERM domain-containing protein
MLDRILPKQADNRFGGHRAALWLLGLFIALKIVMGVNSIFNTESVAVGADGIPLDSYGPAAARQVLTLFALTALGQLTLALVGLTALVRYRALVPFMFAVLLAEQIARRLIVQSHAVVRADGGSPGLSINLGLMALLALGLLLSLIPVRQRSSQAVKES